MVAGQLEDEGGAAAGLGVDQGLAGDCRVGRQRCIQLGSLSISLLSLCFWGPTTSGSGDVGMFGEELGQCDQQAHLAVLLDRRRRLLGTTISRMANPSLH